MHNDAPHHRYFRAKEGHWRGRLRFELTDPRGLRASTLRLADKWQMRSLALASRGPSRLVVSTTVDYASRGHCNEVLHTTRMSNWGVTLFRAAETIVLEDDGVSFRVDCRQAFFPFLKKTEWTARGEVAESYDGASYRMPCFGLMMEQTTRMTAEGLEITQMTPYSQASILLRWQRPLRAESCTVLDSK